MVYILKTGKISEFFFNLGIDRFFVRKIPQNVRSCPMCDCEELLTRLTAAAVAKYNDKVQEVVLKASLNAQA